MQELNKKCDIVKSERLKYVNAAKSNKDDRKVYDAYMLKAEEVDLTPCTTLKEYRKVINY